MEQKTLNKNRQNNSFRMWSFSSYRQILFLFGFQMILMYVYDEIWIKLYAYKRMSGKHLFPYLCIDHFYFTKLFGVALF